MNWIPIEELETKSCSTRYLYRAGDLYPVVGWCDGSRWVLEEGGPEDRMDREYPLVGGSGEWSPTHYAEIDFTGLPEDD